MKYNLKNVPLIYTEPLDDATARTDKQGMERLHQWFEAFEEQIRDRIIRLMSVRAGSIFPPEFEAGRIYAYLQVLGWKPDLKTRQDVQDFVDMMVGNCLSSEDATEWLKEFLEES